jgi:predicted transcriptional regulator
MAQLTIYLDPETQRKVENAARRESLSLSRWAREHLAKAAESETASAWDHLSAFSGTLDDGFEIPSRESSHRPVPSLDS